MFSARLQRVGALRSRLSIQLLPDLSDAIELDYRELGVRGSISQKIGSGQL